MFEINLVPDVKGEMIKAQKIRNLVLFICIVVSAAAAGIVLVLFGVKGTQDVMMAGQNSQLEKMSAKLNSYESLDEFLTIQNQLGSLDEISQKKTVASRVFSILDSVLPNDGDTVTMSNLSLNLAESTLTIEGQADAGKEPMIDYRVLESLKKSVGLVKYDYGVYVDKDGNQIPETCITATDDMGNLLVEDGKYYVEWNKSQSGCNPGAGDDEKNMGSDIEKIYRTPKYEEWSNEGYLSDDGMISGVAHFQSECMSYTKNGSTWTEESSCVLAPEGMEVTESSNGRDSNEALVLRFSGEIAVDPTVFSFQSKNMRIIGPEGQNITDSYIQIGGMFAERASDCAKDDTTCQNANNSGNGSSSSSTSNSNSNSSSNSNVNSGTGTGTNSSGNNTTKENQ